MSKESKYQLNCPECNEAAKRLYSREELLEKYPTDPLTRLNLGMEFICTVCSHTFRPSRKALIEAFITTKVEDGESLGDIKKEMDNKIQEIKDSEPIE